MIIVFKDFKHFIWGFCSVAKSRPILCDPMDCSMPGFRVLHPLSEFAQIHVRWVSDVLCCAVLSRSVVSDSLWPHGLSSPKLPCPWYFSGKSTGVGFHVLLLGDLPNPGMEARPSTLQADSTHWARREAHRLTFSFLNLFYLTLIIVIFFAK